LLLAFSALLVTTVNENACERSKSSDNRGQPLATLSVGDEIDPSENSCKAQDEGKNLTETFV
jgi:hypothetical protein